MMFLTHFNMTQNPFTERPPIEWLQKDERTAQGLARLYPIQDDCTRDPSESYCTLCRWIDIFVILRTI